MPEKLKIIFLGTPDFAVASLDALMRAGMQVAAVVTAPDKPAGRGMQLQESAVKKYAESHNLPVLQPVKLKDPAFLAILAAFKADIQVVVAFRMLPEVVWNMPPLGTVNVHASLLPQYRGAAPINHAIINGETRTGVTTFRLQHEIDTGHILLQEAIPVAPDDNAGSLHDKLKVAGASLLIKTLRQLVAGTLLAQPQTASPDTLTHAPKLYNKDREINWNEPAIAIHNRIRGLSPYPAAFTRLADKQVKIFSSYTEAGVTGVGPGSFETDHRSWLRFAAADGWVYITELQQEGKKRLEIREFLKGFKGK